MENRRMVVLAEGKFSPLESKTANQAIRYLPQQVVAVIDSRSAGRNAQDILGFGGAIPVCPDLRSSLVMNPDTLLIGIAPTGGHLPAAWRPTILEAIRSGLSVISGLHTLLSEDQELTREAGRFGVTLTDLRRVPDRYNTVARGSWRKRNAKTILTVGTDCNVGKMTAAFEIHRELRRRGSRSGFIATGQTGILIAGRGIAVDSVMSDYVAGAVELEIDRATAEGNDVIVVEGQGALTHQGYSAVALGLMHGVMPDAMVMVHHPGRSVDDYGFPLDNLGWIIALHEALVTPFKRSRVVGIALNSLKMTQEQAAIAEREIREETRLPVADPLTPKIGTLADAIMRYLEAAEGI